MQKINDKLFNWASIIDSVTYDQAKQTASMDFIYPHMALMPDAHLGKGATVGSVIPTKGAIMPAAVGVDIGCGMIAVRTQWKHRDFQDKDLRALHADICSRIPLSAGNYNHGKLYNRDTEHRIELLEGLRGYGKHIDALSPNWRQQLGTLGSGNHFIELSFDQEEDVWLFLHSGSRGVGNKLAQTHIKIASALCAGEKLPNRDLAYLTEGTSEFDAYISDLFWAQSFAYYNREEMMDRVMDAVGVTMGEAVLYSVPINCHHNYTERVGLDWEAGTENDKVWLSRKGAIAAYPKQPGLIPGSMGDLSYVVSGKGNPDSLWSAPHGAGRVYSRSKAKERFTREDLDAKMKGIVWGESNAFLDEHPQAYKPVEQVMADAADLVNIENYFMQFVNVKGN